MDWRLFPPLLSRTGRRPTLATLTLDLCDTGFRPITVARPHEINHNQRNEKPRLIIKRVILWGAEKCCRNVTAVRYDRRARRTERVGRSFVGIGVRVHLRRSRPRSPDAREGYRRSLGVFSSSCHLACPI